VKRVTLVRHANAEPQGDGSNDFGRRLTRRGDAEADALAHGLLEEGLIPDQLTTSPAPRARETAEILARQLELPRSIVNLDAQLYLASPVDMLRTVRAQEPHVQHFMMVGHNPGISELARLLAAGAWVAELGTACACTMLFDTDVWLDVNPGQAREVH
jgi:phosphohistidine phosphatase